MREVLRYKWSLLSGLITLVHCVVIIGVVHYLYHLGRWHPDANPRPQIVTTLADVHILGIFLSAAAAVKGLLNERQFIYSVAALTFSLGSFFIYVG